MVRRKTLEKHYYKSKGRKTRNMRKIKGGDFAGIHFGPMPGTSLLTGTARGLTNVSRAVAAAYAKHPEMARLIRYATAFNENYERRMKLVTQQSHDFWWAEKHLFESYYSERLRKKHAQEEQKKKKSTHGRTGMD